MLLYYALVGSKAFRNYLSVENKSLSSTTSDLQFSKKICFIYISKFFMMLLNVIDKYT